MQGLRTSASGTGLREPIVDKRSGKDVFCCRGRIEESGARQQKRDLWAHLDFAQAFDVVSALV